VIYLEAENVSASVVMKSAGNESISLVCRIFEASKLATKKKWKNMAL
jgi:hypothetical protein